MVGIVLTGETSRAFPSPFPSTFFKFIYVIWKTNLGYIIFKEKRGRCLGFLVVVSEGANNKVKQTKACLSQTCTYHIIIY